MRSAEGRRASSTQNEPPPTRSVWTRRRSLVAHVAIVVWVSGCAVATWWQVGIALSGDSLGWVYSVMWPSFAVFATFVWWYLVHDDPETVGSRGLRKLQASSREAEPHAGESEQEASRRAVLEAAEREDPELASYNAYLADLARHGGRKSWTRR